MNSFKKDQPLGKSERLRSRSKNLRRTRKRTFNDVDGFFQRVLAEARCPSNHRVRPYSIVKKEFEKLYFVALRNSCLRSEPCRDSRSITWRVKDASEIAGRSQINGAKLGPFLWSTAVLRQPLNSGAFVPEFWRPE